MLWYKTWRESRSRFLMGALVIAAACLVVTVLQSWLRQRAAAGVPLGTGLEGADAYRSYLYPRVYGGVLRAIYLILVALLAAGGLQREEVLGTLGFTLALPVRRARHLSTRAAVGLVEVAGLAALPVVLVPVGSALVGEAYPWQQAAGFGMLWCGGGAVAFGLTFLLSTRLRRDLDAVVLALVALRLYPLVLAKLPSGDAPWLRLSNLMNGAGMPYFDSDAHRLVGPLPWGSLGGMVAVALVLVATAILWPVHERRR
jgi:hypothetical protein